jgi:hypothetical protein
VTANGRVMQEGLEGVFNFKVLFCIGYPNQIDGKKKKKKQTNKQKKQKTKQNN